jgi:prolyl oligopeptidase
MSRPDPLRRATLFAAASAGLATVLPPALLFPRHALAQAAALSSQPPGLPVAAVRNVPETFFGTTVDDPYRHFEDTKAAEVAAWMKAHSDHAHATLRRIGGRAALRQRLEAIDASASARVTEVQRRAGELFFYQRRGATEDQFKLCVRQGLAGAERVLFDPETLKKATGTPHAINWVSASPDGSKVALGVSAGGSEDASMRVLDVKSGRQLGPIIDRTLFGAVSWSVDGRRIYFHRMQALKKGAPATDKYQRSMVCVMPAGGSERSIRVVLRAGDKAPVEIPATEFPLIEILPDGRAIATVVDGVSPEFSAWHSTEAALRAGRPAWKPLCTRADAITSMAVLGDQVFATTHKGAPRYKLIGGRLEGFSPASAATLVPESPRVLGALATAADAVYLDVRDGNVKKLFKLAAGGAQPQEVALPVQGSFGFTGVNPALPGVMLDLQSWTRARQIYSVAADGTVANTGLQPAGPYDAPANVTATEVMVKSHDGAMVPMSIIHRTGTPLDGANPTILYGYASYGFTEEPFFSPSRLAWMEAGGVFAIANPRGSGVFGKDWHLAGQQATKPNTWKDFIACAEFLVAQKWTRPSRLAIWGGSAGGILVGMAMVERPDLFAVVMPAVGALDMVRAETTPNGVPNIPEFGSRRTEPGFRALLAMSTYHQIRDGVKYPAVLLTHGVNDPRVEVWNTTKAAARLIAASTSGRPVLMRLDYEAGHGIGDTKAQVLDERADTFAFVLWQTGMPGWELAAAPPR